MARDLTTWIPFLLLFALLAFFCIRHHLPVIDADLQEKSNAALAALGIEDTATAAIDGLDVTLTGQVATEAIRDQIEDDVNAKHGVRLVHNELTVQAPAAAVVTSHNFSALHNGQQVILTGMVPDDGVRASIVGAARQSFNGVSVIDQLRIVPSTPSGWPTIIRESLSQLAEFKTGKFDLTNSRLSLVGSVASSGIKTDAVNSVSRLLGDDITPRFDISVLAPTQQVIANCQNQINTLLTGQVIRFATGSAVISVDSYPLLEQMADALNRCAGVTIEVQGHTDSAGDAGANQVLSESRATAVLNHLANDGVDISKLSAKGYGETQPIGDNATSVGRARNRRIEFITLEN